MAGEQNGGGASGDLFEPPEGAAAGEDLRFHHTIQPSAFLGLSLKNGLLNLVTLTLYRFWGKTEVRRRVWRNVRLNDEPFEYTGRGGELFIGFILALVVLGLPFLIIIFGVQFLALGLRRVHRFPLHGQPQHMARHPLPPARIARELRLEEPGLYPAQRSDLRVVLAHGAAQSGR